MRSPVFAFDDLTRDRKLRRAGTPDGRPSGLSFRPSPLELLLQKVHHSTLDLYLPAPAK